MVAEVIITIGYYINCKLIPLIVLLQLLGCICCWACLCPSTDTASRKERNDFLLEIDMMKKISEGCCANIVNMVGCVTIQEPFCLITEFVPHGNLLDYLRNQRQKV